MASIHIDHLDPDTLERLRDRAAISGRSVEEEAKALLKTALRTSNESAWESVTSIRNRLSGSGRSFSDSAELIREDRER